MEEKWIEILLIRFTKYKIQKHTCVTVSFGTFQKSFNGLTKNQCNCQNRVLEYMNLMQEWRKSLAELVATEILQIITQIESNKLDIMLFS